MSKSIAWALVLLLVLITTGIYAQQQIESKTPQNPPRESGGPPLFGTVASVGVDRFEIKKQDGSSQTIMVDEHTNYRQGQQEIQLEDLKAGDRVAVRGQANSSNQFVAAQVRRVTDEELQRFQNAGERAFGEIVSIDKNQIKVNNPRQGEQLILVNEQTQFLKDGQSITLNDLKAGDRIFALGKTEQGHFVATRILTGQFRGPGRRRDNQQ